MSSLYLGVWFRVIFDTLRWGKKWDNEIIERRIFQDFNKVWWSLLSKSLVFSKSFTKKNILLEFLVCCFSTSDLTHGAYFFWETLCMYARKKINFSMDTSKIDGPNEKLIMQEHEGCPFIRLHERNVKRMNK